MWVGAAITGKYGSASERFTMQTAAALFQN